MSPALDALRNVVCAGALACGIAGTAAALRMRASERRAARALRAHAAREAGAAAVSRGLALAARDSVAAVRDALARAVRIAAPQADGVLFYEADGAEVVCAAASGARFAYYAGTRIARGDPASSVALAVDTARRVRAGTDAVRPLHPGDGDGLAVPIALGAGGTYVLAVAAQARLGDDEVERIVALADQAAPAYLIALDREEDRHRAEYDGLTGLLTPRAFRQRLTALVERARFVPSARLSLVFADTDHFKRWNDSYGHAAGDALLRALAGVLRDAAASPHDLVARNGGDEFCVVFEGADKADAIERAERLRARIAALAWDTLRPTESAGALRVTVSLGLAAFPADARTAAELLECADGAMYHAKATGRDGLAYRLPNGTFIRFSGATRAADEVTG